MVVEKNMKGNVKQTLFRQMVEKLQNSSNGKKYCLNETGCIQSKNVL